MLSIVWIVGQMVWADVRYEDDSEGLSLGAAMLLSPTINLVPMIVMARGFGDAGRWRLVLVTCIVWPPVSALLFVFAMLYLGQVSGM